MNLWSEWSKTFSDLSGGFSRKKTFYWFIALVAGLSVRTDRRGVTSVVSVLGLEPRCYSALLRVCHSSAVKLDTLQSLWLNLCFRIFSVTCVDGYMVLLGDGIKIGKEGKKMPGVKLLHQDSQSNSKAPYIMGHFLQAISIMVTTPLGRISAIPLTAKIHDGFVTSNRAKETIIDRFAKLISQLVEQSQTPAIVVADAYYAVSGLIGSLKACGCELVCRVRNNAVAYEPAQQPKVKKRGRPKKKGKKIVLRSLFSIFDEIASISDDGERYYTVDLYWASVKGLVRFVLVENARGQAIFMTTKLDLDPLTVIKLYKKRWLIETGFKAAVHQIGTFAYHFWMKTMKPTKRGKLDTYLHREAEAYRQKFFQKLHAYHVYIQMGCIAQGLILHLAINFRQEVWSSFNGWLRVLRKSDEPSEIVVQNALHTTLGIFLREEKKTPAWAKIIQENQDLDRSGHQAQAA